MSYSSVHVSTSNPCEHRSLLEFCHSRNLPYVEDILIDFSKLDDTYKKPTKQLKAFCGAEWANAKGLIQAKTAVELILRMARRLSLDRAGGIMELNEVLQDVLQTTETSILSTSLPSRVAALLTDT